MEEGGNEGPQNIGCTWASQNPESSVQPWSNMYIKFRISPSMLTKVKVEQLMKNAFVILIIAYPFVLIIFKFFNINSRTDGSKAMKIERDHLGNIGYSILFLKKI